MPPLNIFISYSHNDADIALLQRLRNHLNALGDAIEVWEDRLLLPGDPWDETIRQKLEQADIVLLLLSSNFIASKYIQKVELARAIERHKAGECRVVGIFAREFYFADQVYAQSELVPKNPRDGQLRPIVSKTAWDSDDEPFRLVVERLKKLTEDIRRQRPQPGMPAGQVVPATWPALFGQLPLALHDIERLHTVNCDRRQHFLLELHDHFERHHRDDRNLIYLVASCPRQQPLSLAKRLVYSRAGQFNGFFHRTEANAQDEVNDKVLLKIKASPEATWAEFWKNVQHYILKSNDMVFEDFLAEAPVYWANAQRFALVFRVAQNHWNTVHVEQHLAYIAGQLARLPVGARKLVVFFACDFDLVDCEPNYTKYAEPVQALLQLADQINAADPANSALAVQHLPPVDTDDVNVWLGEVTNDDETNRHLVWPMLQRDMTDDERQRLQPNLYNLRRVEAMQDAAYRYALQHAQ